MQPELSAEQKKFVDWASLGANVLVDACIGSGKTTSIQALCRQVGPTRRVLYLTYNKLLKLDAKARIYGGNAYVSNYHGFAYMEMLRRGIRCGFGDILQQYNKLALPTERYDLLVLDEYQDIDQDIAVMLSHVKRCNPGMQIVAVGDMDQKIYDNTRLDAAGFIVDFLGRDYKPMEFTTCFRLNREWAAQLGETWEKTIIGVNDACEVEVMSERDVADYLSGCEPRDILVLGRKGGRMSDLQNRLEADYPGKFNKFTVWSKIMENDGGATQPDPTCAVFTTYDGSKGMERDVCVLYDWTDMYWEARLSHDVRYEIMRNVFCVAASRGKRKIIIVKPSGRAEALTFDDIRNSGTVRSAPVGSFNVSDMFDYKYTEDVEACYGMLDLERIEAPGQVIDAPLSDGMIDLSPCIGNWLEASYFNNYDLDRAVAQRARMNMGATVQHYNTAGWSVFGKVLYLTAVETNQARYVSQVPWDFVPDGVRDSIHDRLRMRLAPDLQVQSSCMMDVDILNYGQAALRGVCDVLDPDGAVWELKFVSSLSHVHFLQCACYLVLMDRRDGYLWNVRDNELWHVRVPDRDAFLDKVLMTVTKGRGTGRGALSEKEAVRAFMSRHPEESRDLSQMAYANGVTAKEARELMERRGLVLPVAETRFVRYFQKRVGAAGRTRVRQPAKTKKTGKGS